MDFSPAASALAWKFKMRMQVEGNNIHVLPSDVSTSQYVGSWSTSSWAWDGTSFTSNRESPQAVTITYSQGKAVSLKVPRGFDLHKRNLVRAFAATWQLNLEDKPFFTSSEVGRALTFSFYLFFSDSRLFTAAAGSSTWSTTVR